MKTQASKTLKVALAAGATLGRRKVAVVLCLALCTVGLGLSAKAQDTTFITFDPPGSTFTLALSINPAGAITGTYLDTNSVTQAGVREAQDLWEGPA